MSIETLGRVSALRPAATDGSINPLIAGRWSARAIDPDRPVDEATLARVIEAGRWAASSRNNQPWAFVVATSRNPELLKAARRALLKGNSWAHAAPVLMYALSRKRYAGSVLPNPLHKYEAGMAAENMALQAASEGLVFHQMLGFLPWRARKTFAIPGSYAVLAAIAIGHPGLIDGLPDHQKAQETTERLRKSRSEFAFVDRVFGSRLA